MTDSAAEVQRRVEAQKADTATSRPIYRFTIPPTVANGVTGIGMVQLTSDEELRATKRSRNDSHRLAYELAQQALVEVNGSCVSEGDGSRDGAWSKMDPKVRLLVISAYGELHTPEQEDIDSFLKSQKVSVG